MRRAEPNGGRGLWSFFFQAEDGIRDSSVTGVQTCALPISARAADRPHHGRNRSGRIDRWILVGDDVGATLLQSDRRYAALPHLSRRHLSGVPRLTMLGSGLSDAIAQQFFHWFHLVRDEEPRGLADGATWHGFRRDGEKFRDLVTVNLEADRAANLIDAKLCLDRAFVEHPKDGAFARDITASFLRWAIPKEE